MKYIPRDPERIPSILKELGIYWNKPENQDMRLGQLLTVLKSKSSRNAVLFYFEDVDLLEVLNKENGR